MLVAWFLNCSWRPFLILLLLDEVLILLSSFRIFSFSFIFCSLNTTCLAAGFMTFILTDVFWTSWICDLVADINLGEFSIITVSSNFSVLFFFFWYSHHMYVRPSAVVSSSWILFSVSFIFFLILTQRYAYWFFFEREREIHVRNFTWLPPYVPQLGIKPAL